MFQLNKYTIEQYDTMKTVPMRTIWNWDCQGDRGTKLEQWTSMIMLLK